MTGEPITLRYSEALVRRAVGAYWRRTIGWGYVAAMLCMVAVLTLSLVRGDRSWWFGMTATVLVIGIACAVALHVVHTRGSLARLRAMKSPEAVFQPGEERFRITSDIGTSELAWSAISGVWCYPDFWLLFLDRAQFITLPLEHVTPDARQFILDRIRAHGGKVT